MDNALWNAVELGLEHKSSGKMYWFCHLSSVQVTCTFCTLVFSLKWELDAEQSYYPVVKLPTKCFVHKGITPTWIILSHSQSDHVLNVFPQWQTHEKKFKNHQLYLSWENVLIDRNTCYPLRKENRFVCDYISRERWQ